MFLPRTLAPEQRMKRCLPNYWPEDKFMLVAIMYVYETPLPRLSTANRMHRIVNKHLFILQLGHTFSVLTGERNGFRAMPQD